MSDKAARGGAGEYVHPSVQIETYSREIAQHPDQAWQLADKLYDGLDGYNEHIGMPLSRSRYRTFRGLHQAFGGPIVHSIEVETTRRLLPFLEEGGVHEQATALQSSAFDNDHEYPMEGRLLAYRRAVSSWSSGAAEAVLREIEETPSHPYKPVWDVFCAIVPEYSEAERAVRNVLRPQDPREALYLNELIGWSAVLDVVMPYALQKNRLHGLSGRELSLDVLANSERLTWPSTTRRLFLKSSVVGYDYSATETPPPGCPYYEKSQAHELSRPEEGRESGAWKLASLADGPWDMGGACMARIIYAASTPSARQTIDELFAAKEDHTGSIARVRERFPGGSSTAEMRIILSAYMAGDLLFSSVEDLRHPADSHSDM